MVSRRIGNDLPIAWSIYRNGQPESFVGKTIKLYIYEVGGDRIDYTSHATITGNVVSFTWSASDQYETGTYNLILEEYVNNELDYTVDVNEAIILTQHTSGQAGDADYIGDQSCTFSSEISVLYHSYTDLNELVLLAQTLKTALQNLGIASDAKAQTLTDKINAINTLIARIQEYQLTYGDDHAYTDATSSADRQYTQLLWQNAMETISMIEQSLLDGFSNSISPITLKTMQAVVGTESLQYDWVASSSSMSRVEHAMYVIYLYDNTKQYGNTDEVVYNRKTYVHNNTQTTGVKPDDAGQTVWTAVDDITWVLGQTQDFPVLKCSNGYILHYTLGVGEAKYNADVHQYRRWNVVNPNDQQATYTLFQLLEDSLGYYVYVKASVAQTADAQSSSSNNGGIGTSAEFFISTQPVVFNENAQDYYYFLYATFTNGLNGNARSKTTWNGFTEITPGMIRAWRFLSNDGQQWIDFINKSFRVGDLTKYLAYNLNGDGKLRLKGTLVQSNSGDNFPIPVWRGAYSAQTTYYYGDQVTHDGSSWLHTSETTTTGEVPSSSSQYWTVYASKGTADSAKLVTLTASSLYFTYETNESTTPTGDSSITLACTVQGINNPTYAWYYYKNSQWNIINGATTNNYTVQHNSSYFDGKVLKIKVVVNNDVYDETAIYKVYGGEDSISAFLTNPAHTFAGGSTSALASTDTVQVIVFKGITRVGTSSSTTPYFQIGTITAKSGSIPSGMTAVVDSQNPDTINISVTTAMTADSGVLIIPVTVHDIVNRTVNLEYSWAVSKRGYKGSTGCIVRGLTEWKVGDVYEGGNPDSTPPDTYLDIVIYNNIHYKCKQTHTASNSNSPVSAASSQYWDEASEFEFIAAKALAVDDAFISNLSVSKLYSASNNSTTSISGGTQVVTDGTNVVYSVHGSSLADNGSGSGSSIDTTTKTAPATGGSYEAKISGNFSVSSGTCVVTIPSFNVTVGSANQSANRTYQIYVKDSNGNVVSIIQDGSVTIPTSGTATISSTKKIITLPVGTYSIYISIMLFGNSFTLTPSSGTITVASAPSSCTEVAGTGFRTMWSGEGFKATSSGAKVYQGSQEYNAVAGAALNSLTAVKRIVVCTSYPSTEEDGVLYIKVG